MASDAVRLSDHQVALPDIGEAVRGAKVIVFVIPHQFISHICDQMKAHVQEGAVGISLIKVRRLRPNVRASV